MKIRVGCRQYGTFSGFVDPNLENYYPVVVSKLSELSNYTLKNERGEILENIWTFSAIYNQIPESKLLYSVYNKREIWNYPGETHVKNGYLLDTYWKWRIAGISSSFPIFYNLDHSESLFHLYETESDSRNSYTLLDYLDAKHEIYMTNYKKAVITKDTFLSIPKDKNLLIIDRDCVSDADLPYFRTKYNVSHDFIFGNTIEVSKENMDILIGDPEVPICSGYVLGAILAGLF